MKTIYKIGDDLGLPYWRISLNNDSKNVIVSIINFEYGFKSGEDWDKIVMHLSSSKETFTSEISLISTNRDNLESFLPEMIEKYKYTIDKNLEYYNRQITYYNILVNNSKKLLNSDILKSITRDEKLKSLNID